MEIKHLLQDTIDLVTYERVIVEEFRKRGIILRLVPFNDKYLVHKQSQSNGAYCDSREEAIQCAFRLLLAKDDVIPDWTVNG